MLTATRDDHPHGQAHGHAVHYGPHVPPRTLGARFTSSVQVLGSLVGIPLALIGGYSTYHATFSPEGKCQALRANIVSMLDKKTDATTLRLLVQKDVVTFERDCAQVDADAAAAFRNLLAADKPAVAHRVMPPAKIEKAEKVETAVAQPPAKAEKAEKIEKVEKREPVKREALRDSMREAVKRDAPVKEAPVKDVAKAEPPVQRGAPPQMLAVPAAEQTAAPPAAQIELQAEPQIEKIVEQPKPAEAKPVETAAVQPEAAHVDATWVASVRDALRESASQPPAAETASQVAAPIDISPERQAAQRGELAPPAEMGQWRPQAPRPPGLIPSAN